MTVGIRVQKDYYLTEVSLELPADLTQINEMLKATSTTGKLIVQYNKGSVQGINIEQRTKITDAQANEIRPLLEIGEKIL
jgi:hypothetical protein